MVDLLVAVTDKGAALSIRYRHDREAGGPSHHARCAARPVNQPLLHKTVAPNAKPRTLGHFLPRVIAATLQRAPNGLVGLESGGER